MRRITWRMVACGAVMIASSTGAPSFAIAQEKEEIVTLKPKIGVETSDEDVAPKKKKKKKVVVVVDDEGGKIPPAPRVGDPAEEIEEYMAAIKNRNKRLKRRMKDAERAGDFDTADQLRSKVAEDSAFVKDESDRLTTNSPGMIAGGAVLVAAGAVSFVACIVTLIGWGLSAADGDPNDTWGWASLATLGGGLVGIGAGAPLIVIGSRRHPREPGEAWITPSVKVGELAGLTLNVAF